MWLVAFYYIFKNYISLKTIRALEAAIDKCSPVFQRTGLFKKIYFICCISICEFVLWVDLHLKSKSPKYACEGFHCCQKVPANEGG